MFLIPLSPLIFYNYTTHESIFDSSSAYFMTSSYQYQYPEWKEQLLQIEIANDSTLDAIFVDIDLFLKNYFLRSRLPNLTISKYAQPLFSPRTEGRASPDPCQFL